jgi:uncharacterized membrane protein
MELLLGGTLGPNGSIVWTGPEWAVWAAVAGGLLAVGATWPGQRPVAARLGELALWTLAVAGLVVAIARPVWVDTSERLEPGRVAVLVDGSASMGVLEDGVPRSAAVADVLAHVEGQVDDLEVFTFGGGLAAGAPDAYDDPDTDLEAALAALTERTIGERLASVVVITDGLDRGLLRQRFRNDPSPAAPALPGPLTLFQVGQPGDLRDLAVRSIDSGGYAFLRNPFQIRADLEGIGFEGRTVDVRLLEDGAIRTTKQVTLDAQGRGEVAFTITPERAGRFAYEVSVPQYENDAVPANNSLPVVVRVVRDRIRILQVAGSPSWDVKFLRRFLKGDPSVDLVSFFILRTGRDMDNRYGESELSLIAFPYRELFSTDLWSFDAVVFQNFDYEPYFTSQGPALLQNLKDYVEDGGAIVMVGGDRSFGRGGYEGTALEDVLPVQVSDDERPSVERFAPILTPAGQRHPVTRLVPDRDENDAWWARLAAMDGTNIVTRARDDAAVLLRHPSLQDADGQALPILSVREVGEGRTMALTIDSSWRWSMSEAAEGRGNQAYLRFWKNSLRWMMKDASVSRLTVDTARENYAVGDDVRLVVRARDPGFAPLPGAAVKVVIDREGTLIERTGVTTEAGDLVVVLPADRRGTHKVRVTATRGTETVGEASTVFAVTARDPELDEVRPDAAFLAALAQRTDGLYHPAGTLGPVRVDPDAGRKVTDRSEVPVWRAPALLGGVLLCAGLAWILRRRSGLR